ncbi:hypothetical protein ACQEWB_49750 [Streptomyces sp. CA-249302]|uniref:hypothetical protein n=1 Tax=Streptomyces sp. CA-249302 TaxID=3240058 RepID=UPI003D917B93
MTTATWRDLGHSVRRPVSRAAGQRLVRQAILTRRPSALGFAQRPQMVHQHLVEAGDVAQPFVQAVQQDIPRLVAHARAQVLLQSLAGGGQVEDVPAQIQEGGRQPVVEELFVLLVERDGLAASPLPQDHDGRRVPHVVQTRQAASVGAAFEALTGLRTVSGHWQQ